MRRRRVPEAANMNQTRQKVNLYWDHWPAGCYARRGVSQNNLSVLSETADKRRWTQI
jgi:hypothetical protein